MLASKILKLHALPAHTAVRTNLTSSHDMTAYYFISVNYKTSHEIENWATNIRNLKPNANLYIVDSFSNEEEKKRTSDICRTLQIELLYSENLGYGNSLNIGLDAAKRDAANEIDSSIFVFGNLDVAYMLLPDETQSQHSAYALMPDVMEGTRNRNPFMTKLQRKFAWLYWPAAKAKSNTLFLLAALTIKILGKIPSKAYACHGSVFCLNGLALKKIDEPIFNKKSFLYWEEIDYADLLNKHKIPLIKSKIAAKHARNASTFELARSRQNIINYWAASYENWIERYQ